MSDTVQVVSWSLGTRKSGQLWLPPAGPEPPDALLWQSIERTGLEPSLRECFQITDPLWYGLWIDSPLTRQQCQALQVLFADLIATTPRYAKYAEEFLVALQAACQSDEVLTVALGTPGHVDLGWITTFAHCPRCKAEAPLKRWQDSYPVEPIECPICGHSYSPAATYSSKREYFAESIECPSCRAARRVRDFPADDIRILEDEHNYKQACEELAWLLRVAAFYERYPDMEGAIEPDFMLLFDSEDERVEAELNAGVPFSDIEPPAGDAAPIEKSRSWSAEDREVIAYLRVTSFSVVPRMKFVQDRVETLRPIVRLQSVACPACGGKLTAE